MSIAHSSGYIITFTEYGDGTVTAVARDPETMKRVHHKNAPTADIALKQVEGWIDRQSVLHEPVGTEVTPTVVEVVPPTPDDGAAAEIGELPTGGFEPEVFEVVSVDAVELVLDALPPEAGQQDDPDPGVIPVEIGDDAVEADQALGGADEGADLDTGGLTEED